MKVEKEMIFLQWPDAGEQGPYNYGYGVHEDDANKFVFKDQLGGGEPCAVSIEKATNFGTVARAERYCNHAMRRVFKIVKVKVTFEVQQ